MTRERNPSTHAMGDAEISLRPMTADDKAGLLSFAKALPPHDLLFLTRDITKRGVVDAWIAQTDSGAIETLVAEQDGRIVGCSALITDPLSWSPHLGELRVLVDPSVRKHGLGRVLIEQCFAKALDKGLKKLTAQMTVDQKGAITLFEELGFRGEALLRDHVRDADEALHDIVILACDVEQAAGRLEAYGMAESS
ncbi:GNAT family N-acetyltransferase [Parasphingopyxis sp. CP4]|uniref:GNAT family N-acetyltransferase n=1 Tax=Parasphingopyxis sp. CP4 TaxID=2724527 RepID=UPI0015A17F1E|nr:GNAT family N-acetyltransferase [Parasphingopyxis sp. CP4]QLC22736.1 GNAT family N-acetyltransferase [Parasphingopyxis sp. CP4]